MRIKSDRKAESVGGRGGMIRRLLDRLRMWARIQNTQAEPTPYKYQNLEEDLKRIQERLRRRQEAGPDRQTRKRGFDGREKKKPQRTEQYSQ